MSDQTSFKRPDFLKVAGAGAAAALSLAGLNPAEAIAAPPKTWDDEPMSYRRLRRRRSRSAIEAADAGARVLLLEKSAANKHVNNTNVAGGLFISPNDVGKAFQYIKACIGDTVDDSMCRLWAEATSHNVAYLQQLAKHVGEAPDVLRFGGAEFPDLPGADGIDIYVLKSGPGAKIFEVLGKNVDARKRTFASPTSSPGKKLIQDASGAILGVVAERNGKLSTFGRVARSCSRAAASNTTRR